MPVDVSRLERDVQALGREIFSELRTSGHGVFSSEFYSDKLMAWAMEDEAMKVSLFRFIDVLPRLPDGETVLRHVREYFQPLENKLPAVLRRGLSINPGSIASALAAKAIKAQVRHVAERFVVGESSRKALPKLKQIRKNRMAFTVDLVGEATVSEAEAEQYRARYAELLAGLAAEVPLWKESAAIIPHHRAEKWSVNISVKPSALFSQARPVSTDADILLFAERFAQIFSLAKRADAFVYIDMEDSSLTTPTLEAFKLALSSREFLDFPQAGIVLQAYLRRTPRDLEDLVQFVRARKTPIALRLVKGAYWDTETILAIQQGWPIPVWQTKVCSDAAYEALSMTLLENHRLIMPAFASHNVRSLAYAITAAAQLGVPPTDFEIQCLYGMAEPVKEAFAARGFLVREYCPVGELIPGMGYLVRRLLENTSNEGFLRQSFHDNKDVESLLARPEFIVTDTGMSHVREDRREEFFNCPLRDFSLSLNRELLSEALALLRGKIKEEPLAVLPVVAGERVPAAKITEPKRLASLSPEDKGLVVANVTLGDRALAERALASCNAFFPTWRDTSATDRAELLFKTADAMERRRDEITAAIVYEAGKPWVEADADIAEAIDFLAYYAHEALRIFKPRKMGNFQGEHNLYFYEPRGVTLVLCPWNFPVAIPCGMFAAALVTGNCAILKPAEQTTLVASLLFECFIEAGLPAGAGAFLPGLGEDVGAYLSQHQGISTIVFTGSKEVGLRIMGHAAQNPKGGQHVKRIIAEMGGKNAIIVDDDADLDEAVKGVVLSAFGYQGQKCSAASRAIVLEKTYDNFIERLAEATKSLRLGPPSDPATFAGPVIDDDAFRRIRAVIQDAKKSCRLVAETPLPPELAEKGYYVPPVVFADIPRGHKLLVDEIFGPVLAVMKAASFKEAVAAGMETEYGLTGAVFSRSPGNIAYAQREFRVGNLYINRGSTGAIVMRQPFGGAMLSGVGSKAGGPDYLQQFVIPRTITENTLRRGFAPPE